MIINLYDFQKEMISLFQNNDRSVVLSARQLGKTTCSCIYLLWFAIFNKDKEIAVLANKQTTASSIVGDLKTAYELLPAWLKPGVKKYDSLTIEFDNGTKLFARATSPDALRGESISLLFLDEFAFIPENISDRFWAGLQPTLSTGGSVIIVSTPNGAAGLYYNIWKKAGLENSGWGQLKIPWSAHPDRDEEWKKQTIIDLGSMVRFNQEHNCSFTGSTYTLIEGSIMEDLKYEDPIGVYDDGNYLEWDTPKKKRIYAASCDVAKGVNLDYHVLNIYDVTNHSVNGSYEQVAMYRCNAISVFDFKNIVLALCKKWNNCAIIVENDNLGHVVAHNLYFEDGYENVYYDRDVKNMNSRYGVNSAKRKSVAVTHLKEDIENGRHIIRSEEYIKELGIFEEHSPGVFKARKGVSFHDDIVATGYWMAYLLRDQFWEEYLYWYQRDNNIAVESDSSDEAAMDGEVAHSFFNSMDKFGAFSDSEVGGFMDELRKG
jgi:hypothetical protein